MNVATYLSQEGFNESRKGQFFSREISTSVNSTADELFWNLTHNEFTYKDIKSTDLPKAVDAIHKFEGTGLVVVLYNLQRDVIIGRAHAIKEDI